MNEKGIKFGVIRKYCSYVNRVSICFYETSAYENYEAITQVPADYDELYLYGVGAIEGEFPDKGGFAFRHCIEIVLSKEPRVFGKESLK